jgi:hypothetical protein
MAARTPLPVELTAGAFTVARARELSVSRGRLRNPELVSPTRGVRHLAMGDVELLVHAGSFASALPSDVVFSHLTAARLHGLPTPKPWPGPAEPLHVMRDRRRPRIERRGCVPHKGLETRRPVEVHGLRATSPLDSWLDLAGRWSHPQLLAAADVLLRRAMTTPDELRVMATARMGRRHATDLVQVARLARAGAASPGESLARWWFWHWGLPEPELNVPVLDRSGSWLATADFVWRRARVVGEYDGDVHRTDRATWERDRERRATIEDAGWTYVEMTARSFADDAAREALRRRLGRLLLLF